MISINARAAALADDTRSDGFWQVQFDAGDTHSRPRRAGQCGCRLPAGRCGMPRAAPLSGVSGFWCRAPRCAGHGVRAYRQTADQTTRCGEVAGVPDRAGCNPAARARTRCRAVPRWRYPAEYAVERTGGPRPSRTRGCHARGQPVGRAASRRRLPNVALLAAFNRLTGLLPARALEEALAARFRSSVLEQNLALASSAAAGVEAGLWKEQARASGA